MKSRVLLKSILSIFVGIGGISSAQAVEVLSARHDAETNSIVAELTFPGGLSNDHKFRLKLDGGCAESAPVQCSAKVVHSSRDGGEALLRRTVSLSLADAEIQGDYFQDAKITVRGAKTQVVVRLKGIPGPATAKPDEQCVSHTGSKIRVFVKSKLLTVNSVDGVETKIGISKVESIVSETYPTQWQTTYELKDGRRLVTVYRGDSKTGVGRWLRTDGSSSPEFNCKSR